MPPSIQGPRDKLEWANKQLETFHSEIRHFLKMKPYGTSRRFDGKRGGDVYRFKIKRPAPARLGLILADFVVNLRSSMDYLIYELSRWKKDDPGGTGFPLMENDGTGKDGFNGSGAREQIKFLKSKPKIIEEIKTVQPYNGYWQLGILNKFRNRSVHRLTEFKGAAERAFISSALPFDDWPTFDWLKQNSMGFGGHDDGDELIFVPRPAGPFKEEFKPEFSFHILFAQDEPGAGYIADWLAQQMYDTVANDVFPRFKRFF